MGGQGDPDEVRECLRNILRRIAGLVVTDYMDTVIRVDVLLEVKPIPSPPK
jgi:hypothetical protein